MMNRRAGRLSLAVLSLVAACFLISEDEVARVTSPNGLVDAILTETNGGATTSFGYLIYVAPRGASRSNSSKAASLYGATRSDQAYGVNLKRRGPDELAVEYFSAKSAGVIRHSVSVGDREIRVSLVSGVGDPAAPPGGMLYNLQGRPDDH